MLLKDKTYTSKTLARVAKFMTAPMTVIDLVAILPWYLTKVLSGGGAMTVLRIVRLARVTRLFKAAKRSPKLLIFIKTFQECTSVVVLLCTCITLVAILFGTLLLAAEQGSWYGPNDDCMGVICSSLDEIGTTGGYMRPNVVGNGLEMSPIYTVIQAGWTVVVTVCTVGYGDTYPTTVAGKMIMTCAMIVGLMVMALPITILGGSFVRQFEIYNASVLEVNMAVATRHIDHLQAQVRSAPPRSMAFRFYSNRLEAAKKKLHLSNGNHIHAPGTTQKQKQKRDSMMAAGTMPTPGHSPTGSLFCPVPDLAGKGSDEVSQVLVVMQKIQEQQAQLMQAQARMARQLASQSRLLDHLSGGQNRAAALTLSQVAQQADKSKMYV